MEYLLTGASRVVFDYVFLRPSHLGYFLDAFDISAETSLHMFTLWAPLDAVRERERERAFASVNEGRALLVAPLA